MRASLGISACLLSAALVSPLLAQPALTRAVPAGFAAGETTEVTLHGTKLTGATSVWASFGGQVEIIAGDENDKQPSDTLLRCRITVPEGLPVQIVGLVVATPEGASPPLLVMIDDLPSVAEDGKNTSLETSQIVEPLAAVDGVTQSGSSDFFAFDAAAGQRVAVEAVAQRLGSKCDPVLWLRDKDGVRLRLVDDDPGLAADCRFAHTFDTAGRYVVEVRDNAYRAGLPYRLRIGDFPLVTTPLPLAAKAGEKTQLELAVISGDDGDEFEAVAVMEANALAPRLPIVARRKGGKSSALATVAVSDLNELTAGESEQAIELPLPCGMSGRLENAGDEDAFHFTVKKGEKLNFTAQGGSLGSPTLVSIRVVNDKGAILAETGYTAGGEPSLNWTAPADGDYLLNVRDLLDRGGPGFTYRVAIERTSPDFALALESDKIARSRFVLHQRDSYFPVDVVVDRKGYEGPIELSVEGPGKWQLYQNVIREKTNAAQLLIVPEQPLEPGTFFPLRIVGTATAKINDRVVRRTAGSTALVRTQSPGLLYPPAWLDGLVSAGATGEAKPLFELAAPDDGVQFTQGSEETVLTVTPKRINNDLKSNLTVKAENLPKGFTYRLKIDGKAPKEKYEITIRGPKDAELAEHEFTLLAFGDVDGRGQVLRQTVKLHVVKPSEPKKDDQ
jgi:hypothetical protein